MKKSKTQHWAKFIIVFLAMLIISFDIDSIAYAEEDDEKVEVEAGPEFTSGDGSKIQGCVEDTYKKKFPMDLFEEIPSNSLTCPTLNMFGFEQEICQVTQIWASIKPGIFIMLLYQGVLHL